MHAGMTPDLEMLTRTRPKGAPGAGDILSYRRQKAHLSFAQIAMADGAWTAHDVIEIERMGVLARKTIRRYLLALGKFDA